MDRDDITVGTLVALKSGALGVVTHIAGNDSTVPASTPIRVQLNDEGAMIQIAYEEIAETHPGGS